MTRGPRGRHPQVVLLLGLLAFATFSTPALAADGTADPTDDDPPEIALRLSPAVLEIPDEPGPSRHDLRVDNLGSAPLTVVTQFSDFTVTEDGTTRFLGPDELSATTWATLDVDTFTLEPDERRDVVLTVEVPDDAEPGERYLSVIFAVPGDPDGGGNITVTHRVAVKLFVAVPGERTELVELGELAGPRLIDTGPATFELTVHNRGNVHRRFEEDTRLLATHRGDATAFENFTVLGGTSRVIEAVWADPPLLCWCTVEVEVDDGRGNLLTASTRVLAFPLRLSLALLILTLGLTTLAIGRRRRRSADLDRRLDAARREGATTVTLATASSAAAANVAAPSPAASGPAASSVAASSVAASSARPAPVLPEPVPSERSTSPLDATLFTAHGTGDRRRRRRR